MKLGHKAFSLFFTSILLFTSFAQAQTETYRARLSPMPTTPQTVSTILGEGEVILTLNGNSSVATMAHIHNGPPAQPGPVVYQLEIADATSGEVSASLELSDIHVEALRANELYVQIHSETNAPGELRGWIFERQ